jgi:signal transduction histidine kinase
MRADARAVIPPAFSAVPPAGAVARRHPVSVLLVYAETRTVPAHIARDEAFRATLHAGLLGGVFFYTEYLDATPLSASAEASLVEVFKDKYRARPIDLVVPTTSVGLRFVLRHRAQLFPDVPIVFMSVNKAASAGLDLSGNISGVWQWFDWAGTLDVALRLQPRTRRVAVVSGTGARDQTWLATAREQLAPYRDRLEIRYLPAPSLGDVLQGVARLPADAIVLLGTFHQDGSGREFIPAEVASRVSEAAAVAVYGLLEPQVGRGIVGGRVLSPTALAEQTAQLALRVLAGENPGPTAPSATVGMFDWRQLQRWRLDEGRLPAGSVVRFREPSVWERHRWWIVGGTALIVLQSTLIAALLVHRALRRRAQRALAERLRFETLLTDLSAMFATQAESEAEGRIETALRRVVEELKVDRASLLVFETASDKVRVTHTWAREGAPHLPEAVRGDELPWIASELRHGHVVRLGPLRDLAAESTVQRSVERFGTRSEVVVPLVVGGATMGGLALATLREVRLWPEELVPRLRILADLFASALARQTAERAAHESATQIQSLAGRLIKAQEEERRRIARELHDGVNQKLSALSIALAALGQRPASKGADLRADLARLQERASGLVEEVRQISHELHPGVLQHVGLVAALQGYCEEFENEHGLGVSFRAAHDLGVVPADPALCLYRATQEALGNAARHAKARHVRVTLTRDGADVKLTVADDGGGFDLTEARDRGGLGLISLDERVRLVGGQVTIQTSPQSGTEVRIVVPVPERADGAADGSTR